MATASHSMNVIQIPSRNTEEERAREFYQRYDLIVKSYIQKHGDDGSIGLAMFRGMLEAAEKMLANALGERGFRLHGNAKLENKDQTNLVRLPLRRESPASIHLGWGVL